MIESHEHEPKWRGKLRRYVRSQESLEAATEAIGARVPQSTLSRLLQAGRDSHPTWNQMRAIAKALDLSLDWLADDEADDPPDRQLTDDEARLLALYRRLDVPYEEAARALLDAEETYQDRHPAPARPRAGDGIQRTPIREREEPRRRIGS